MAVTYCSVDDVANTLGFPDGYFDANSTPTSTDIEDIINEAEDSIDNHTGHAWRTKTVTKEYIRPSSIYRHGTGIRFDLTHRKIQSLTKLEVWENNEWVDWVATKTEGRDKDYWYDKINGVVFLLNIVRVYPHGVRVTYTYGETTVSGGIKKATKLMAALEILNSPEFITVLFTQVGEVKPTWTDNKDRWEKKIEKILDNNQEFQ